MWVVFLRFLIRTLGIVSTIILARLLTPADYGLIALATVIAAAVELLSSFNFDVWLLRHPKPGRAHFDTVWTLSVLRGCITALALWVLANPLAGFFDDPRLADVVYLIAFGQLLSSFANVGVVNFQRDLRFDKDLVFNVAIKVGAFIVTVSLGVLWRDYWALAAGIVTADFLRCLVSYGMHPYRPRPSMKCWREAYDFSKWLLIGNFLSFVCRQSDTFVLGKLAGGRVLGLYNVAKEISNLAAAEIVMPIRRVMVPGYARLQDDLSGLRTAFVEGFGIIMMIGVPCAIGIAVVANPLIRVMLGPQWIDAIPVMQVLGLNGVAVIGLANQWPTLIAVGRPELASVLLAVCAAILLPLLYFGSLHYGAVGAAFALGAVNFLLFVLGLVLIRRLIQFRWLALWKSVWRTVVATIVMALAVAGLQAELFAREWPALVILVTSVAMGAAVYAAALFLQVRVAGARHGPEHQVIDFVRQKLPGAARRP